MKRYLIISLVGSTLLGLFACSNNNNSTPPFTGAFRLIDGTTDSTSISASATSGFTSVGGNFDSAGSTVNPPEGSYNVQLTESGASGPFATVNNVSIDHNNLTTLYTYGTIGGGTANGFAVEENLGAPSGNNFTFQFVNDTTQTATATLDVYLVTPGAGIGSTQPLGTVKAGAASTATGVPAGTYEVIVTNGVTTVYDSGSTGIVLPNPDSNVIQIGALDATAAQAAPVASGGDDSPITLIVIDNNGGEKLHLNGNG